MHFSPKYAGGNAVNFAHVRKIFFLCKTVNNINFTPMKVIELKFKRKKMKYWFSADNFFNYGPFKCKYAQR